MTPEFSRPYRVDTLGAGAREFSIEASEEERAALARRFDLIGIAGLAARAEISRSGDVVIARGRVSATVTQACIATGEPIDEIIEEEFRIEFRPQPLSGSNEEEIELSEGELDVVFYDGPAFDLGEAMAETVSLALNPFPRSPSAEEALRQAGVRSEEEARAQSSPFAALGALKGEGA